MDRGKTTTSRDWTAYERTCAPDRQLDGLGDLALFLGGSEDSFTGQLLALIAKGQSTPEHLAALERGFPTEVLAWRTWQGMSPAPVAAELCEVLTLRQAAGYAAAVPVDLVAALAAEYSDKERRALADYIVVGLDPRDPRTPLLRRLQAALDEPSPAVGAGPVGKAWLYGSRMGTPGWQRDALVAWAEANHLPIDQVLETEAIEVDMIDRVIRYVELSDTPGPGTWPARGNKFYRRVTVPLVAELWEELKQPPVAVVSRYPGDLP